MAPLPSGLYRATNVNWHYHMTKLGTENPLGIEFPSDGTRGDEPLQRLASPEKLFGSKGVQQAAQEYLEVTIDKAFKLVGMDHWPVHTFCVTAYYPGESPEIADSRKTSFAPKKSGSRREDCVVFHQIRVPYNPRQQLLFVDLYEVTHRDEELIGRATLPLADPKVEGPAEWPLIRGFDYAGTLTARVKLPGPEVKARPPPDLRDFPRPVSPREVRKSKVTKFDKGGMDKVHQKSSRGEIDMSPFDEPRKGLSSKSSTGGGIDMTPFDEPRKRSSSSGEGTSPLSPPWMPVINGPGGSGFGLDPKIDDIWKFEAGVKDLKGGTISPLPSFTPDWFVAKLPAGTPLPVHRPLPRPTVFHPAGSKSNGTVDPAVAAMVAQALLAPPLLPMATIAMPMVAQPVRAPAVAAPFPAVTLPARPAASWTPCYAGSLNPLQAKPTVVNAPFAYGRNIRHVAAF